MDDVPRFLASILAGAALIVLGTSPAGAHASLVSTDPADGSTLKSAPRTIQMTFSEGIRVADVSASAPDGGVVGMAEPVIDGVNVSADMAPTDQRGEYRVSYRVVAADGHAASGVIRFTATTGRAVQPRPQPVEQTDGGGTDLALVVLGVAAALVVALVLRARMRERRS